MFRYVATLLFAFSAVALGDSISKVNGSIRVEDGQSAGDVSTVNGSITVGRDARAEDVSTVNGSIRLEEQASAREAGTVNGAIRLAERAQLYDSAGTVNGEITLEREARVGGSVENVNGKLAFHGAQVGGDIETVNGDVLVGAGSRVDGGIRVEKSEGWFRSRSTQNPKVTIESGAVVSGPLRFEREVDLYVADGATVGAIEGVPPRRRSPP